MSIRRVRGRYIGLSIDTKPLSAADGDEFLELDTGIGFVFDKDDSVAWVENSSGITGGNAHVRNVGFKNSQYVPDLVMNGTAQVLALPTGVKLGAGKVDILNQGTTGQHIRIAFGADATNASDNLNIVSGAATTGTLIAAIADSAPRPPEGVPALMTHIAFANAVSGHTQSVAVGLGV